MILVIGDSCIDRYLYGQVRRICPEAPVPVFEPQGEPRETGGMSANVAANLEALGCEVELFTNETKPIKTRYIDQHSGQMVLRRDENDKIFQPLPSLGPHHLKAELVIMSDYNKGFMSEAEMTNFAGQFDCPIFVDTKKKLGDWLSWATCVKINDKEWHDSHCPKMDNLCVTQGPAGALWRGERFLPPNIVEVRDVCGAGDTFLAALAAMYLKSKDMRASIEFALLCAAEVVCHPGVVPVPEKFRKFL
jgi:D-beta-D-heptose 7-phosphate kinase/D-beta-D-heptose 1-phosphate adenosyltransferase